MPLNILICGGGCGGPPLAFWLAGAGHNVTIIERFPVLRASGAQIDLRDRGITVAKRMGLMNAIRKNLVDEEGMALVDSNGKIRAAVMANKTGKGAQGPSSEFEIMRGDLVQVFYEATKDTVRYIFGMTVDSFERNETGVTVRFSDGKTDTFDILVGADGQGSRIRKSILTSTVDPLRHFNVFMAHWRVPTVASDDKISRCCHLPGGRMIMTRTHSPTESQAVFTIRDEYEELKSIPKASTEAQKEFWANKFKDAGWIAPRLIEGMQTSDYFYSQEIVQVRTDTWYKGRAVLLADAAYCPSPMTGMGTTAALVGAYILAGEITEHIEDLDVAFANYDRKLRPFVEEIQQLPQWVLSFTLPRSQWLISLLHSILGWVTFLRIPQLLMRFSKEERGGWELPDYPLLDKVVVDKQV